MRLTIQQGIHEGILLTWGLAANVNCVSLFHGKITASALGDYFKSKRESEREREYSDKSKEGYLPFGEGSWLSAAAITTAMLMFCRHFTVGAYSKEDGGNSKKVLPSHYFFITLTSSPKSQSEFQIS